MTMKLHINEIFEGIQGEGRSAGFPALFIRLSGCTRKCPWCDTQYHIKYNSMKLSTIVKKIKQSNKKTIVFTGGEPLLNIDLLKQIISICTKKHFTLETNGDLIKNKADLYMLDKYFQYICISPKELRVATRIHKMLFEPWYDFRHPIDIKIVTDLDTVGIHLIPYATILMPLTTFDTKKDLEIKQKVWKYCVENNLHYSPRLHVDLWGNVKGK